MTSTFLFAVWAGGGNVPPQLALARRLVAAGHEAHMLAPAVLKDRIEAAGVGFEPYRATPEHDDSEPARSLSRDFEYRSPLGAAKATRDRLFVNMAEPVAADVLAILERRPVDVVVPDYMLMGALFAAEKAAVPAAPLVHHIYPFPARGLPPFGNGWAPRSNAAGAIRDRLGSAMFNQVWAKPMLQGLNRTRSRLGLPQLGGLSDLLATATRVLVLTSPSFDFSAELPANVKYVGPQLEEPEWTPPWTPPWADADARPTVLVSLSTTYQKQERVLDRTIAGLRGLPVRAVVITGPAEVTAAPPPNCHLTAFVPHTWALRHADVVVTHAGHGTVLSALSHGLPLVCLPMGRDQHDTAARVAWHGAGVRLSARSSPDKIAASIEHVLGAQDYADAARRLREAILRENPTQAALDELGQLAANRRWAGTADADRP